MNPNRPCRTLASLTGALALTLLALPAAAGERFPRREHIPDAVLRNVTHVVCATFPGDAEPSLPVYERGEEGFQRAGTLPRGDTHPVSRWEDTGWQEDCYPAAETARAEEAGGTTWYAHVIVDLHTGKKAWLREGGEARAAWVTVESLRTLEAFEDKRVEFHALLHPGHPLVLREEPHDAAAEVESELPVDVILGQRRGDFAEVLAYEPSATGYRRLGWVRVVDETGLLLLWPAHFETHGC